MDRTAVIGTSVLMFALLFSAVAMAVAVPSDTDGSGGPVPMLSESVADAHYTVVFHSNDGNEVSYFQSIKTGHATALSENMFENDGYDFKGWATTSTGPVCYSDRQTVSDIAETDGSLDLYAVWGQPSSGIPTWTCTLCIIVVGAILVFAVIYSRRC